MTRPLILHRVSSLIMNALNPSCYLHCLLESSLDFYLSIHIELNSKINPLIEPHYLFSLGGHQESCITRKLHKPHLILSDCHTIILQMLKLTMQLIPSGERNKLL